MNVRRTRALLTVVVWVSTAAIVATFHIGAAIENIHDMRAQQVSWMFAASVCAAWLLALFRASKPRTLTAVVHGASVGVWVAFDLCVLALTPWVLITPPIAWLVVTGASALGCATATRNARGT